MWRTVGILRPGPRMVVLDVTQACNRMLTRALFWSCAVQEDHAAAEADDRLLPTARADCGDGPLPLRWDALAWQPNPL
eukprot:scaffold20443_cov146-Isochrysis_galbana.AAC.2